MKPILTFSPQNSANPIIRIKQNGKPKTQKELSNEILKGWKHRTISNREMAIAVFDTNKPTRTQMVRASFLLCKAVENNLVERMERGIYQVHTQNSAPKTTKKHACSLLLNQYLDLGDKYKEHQKVYFEFINEIDELADRVKKLSEQSDKVSEQMNDIDTEMLTTRKKLDALLNDSPCG